MKKSVGVLALGLCVLSASAFADCGTFDQLVNQSQTLQTPFGDLSNPDCSNKPDESVVDNLISCFEGLSGEPARTQSEADLQLSTLYGIVTQCYSSGIGKDGPGKKSYQDLVASTQADPTYEDAWMTFAETIAGMKQQGWIERQAIQLGLGISIDDELQVAINGLSALPQDAAVSQELATLKSLQ